MELMMIRYGLVAGASFLLSVALLDWLACGGRPAQVLTRREHMPVEQDISDQVFKLLAEARRITEESA